MVLAPPGGVHYEDVGNIAVRKYMKALLLLGNVLKLPGQEMQQTNKRKFFMTERTCTASLYALVLNVRTGTFGNVGIQYYTCSNTFETSEPNEPLMAHWQHKEILQDRLERWSFFRTDGMERGFSPFHHWHHDIKL